MKGTITELFHLSYYQNDLCKEHNEHGTIKGKGEAPLGFLKKKIEMRERNLPNINIEN
jgi:hypothetical protein